MGHSHDHGTENIGDGKLIAAVGVNVLLTAAPITMLYHSNCNKLQGDG